MRVKMATALVLALSLGQAATAQRAAMAAEDKRMAEERAERAATCAKLTGIAKDDCMDERNQRPVPVVGKPISKADAKLVSDAFAAGNAKRAAQDYTGAIADYDRAIAAVPNHPGIAQLQITKAASLRARAVAAFNAGLQGGPSGQTAAVAAATPDLKAALAAAGAAAAAIKDPVKEAAVMKPIGVEMRESASLLYQIDKSGTLGTARPTSATEAQGLRQWIAETPAPNGADIAKYGYAVAAAELARDRTAGLALVDEVQGRAGNDPDATIAYADLIAAAKLPAGDAHRAKAAAAIATLETGGTTNDAQKAKIRRIKAALATPV